MKRNDPIGTTVQRGLLLTLAGTQRVNSFSDDAAAKDEFSS